MRFGDTEIEKQKFHKDSKKFIALCILRPKMLHIQQILMKLSMSFLIKDDELEKHNESLRKSQQ